MSEDKVLMNNLSAKYAPNKKISILYKDNSDRAYIYFSRIMAEDEKCKNLATSNHCRLGMRTTGIALTDDTVRALIDGLIQYLDDKKND